ncbi:MAG: Bax inhibitor-1/YccA family protein [Phycisphaerae bacterium]
MSQFFNSPGSGYNDTLVPGVRSDALEQRSFMAKVFGWMSVGLLITGIVALLVSENPKFVASLEQGGFWIVFIAQIGLVLWFSAGLNRMSAGLATILFLAYSALTGLTFAILFLIYTQASVYSTFFITAGTFGSMALYGYVTKRDLTGLGHYAGMALWGVILALVVNMFMHNSGLESIINVVGVLVFVVLTAYDVQKAKFMYLVGPDGSQAHQKAAVSAAFNLYLDFINMFIFLLMMFGRQRD